MGKGNDILPIKTLGFSLGDWIPIKNLDSHLHPEVEGPSHQGRVRNALSPSLMSLLTSSSLSAVVAIGTGNHWLVGQRLDVKSDVCPISVKPLSNLCPIG